MPELLFTPLHLGRIELKNRAVMSPMTRSRSPGHVPSELVATYYAQRAADAGLIVTEGTSPSPNGLGYPRIPGLFNDAQVRGWRLVTEAVHARGGRIFVQLMHTGRVTHEKNLPSGGRVLAPTAIELPDQKMWVDALSAQVPLTPGARPSAGRTASGPRGVDGPASEAPPSGLELALLRRSGRVEDCCVIILASSSTPGTSRHPPQDGASQRDPYGDKGIGEVALRPQGRAGRPNAPLGS
jgi:hypothetical protein